MAKKQKSSPSRVEGNMYLVTWLDAAFYFDSRPETHGEICRTLGFYLGVDEYSNPLFAMESSEPFDEDSCRCFMAIPEGMILTMEGVGIL